ncbi:MAG: YmdB family metallophosphoesterase [Spirochaetales bacterium]|jgi:2',3'-cyclic-nucleotide 2'-phosphodiesterase|nr:YmdB family metallophosphoesterase [Spirochaetales bacterium]
MSTRVAFLGEIVGKAGVYCVKKLLPNLVVEKGIDFVIASAEGTTGGFGLGKNHSIYLHKLGIDVLTGGECIFYKIDMVDHIKSARYILRPANYPPGNPGRGWYVYQKGDVSIGVIVLLGQSGFDRIHLSNPFTYLPDLVARVREQTDIVILDFHAATTAEKYSMFYHADGKVSAVIGTHMKVMTSDETILAKGTGIICDVGRCGSQNSVGGLDPDIEIRKFLTQVPVRSKDAWNNPELQGVVLDINENGKTEKIERFKLQCEVPHDGKSDN